MNLNWQRITLNLRTGGCPSRVVQKEANMDSSTLGRLQRGEIREPRFSQGLALLDLHERFCPEKHSLSEVKL